MKYILVNKQNVIVDICSEARYIKRHSKGALVYSDKKAATSIIGSDYNTFYPLANVDAMGTATAVRVIERETLPEEVVPGLFKYDPETNDFVYRYSLSEAQIIKQEKNKELFAACLDEHPLIWVDGKKYGITLEDQTEISLNLNQYQIAVQGGIQNPTLEWHAKQEACTPWTFENLTALSLAITQAVYPYYRKCQDYKRAIFETTSIEELDAIEITYGETAATE